MDTSKDNSDKTPIIDNGGKSRALEETINHIKMHSIQEHLEGFVTACLEMSISDVANMLTASSAWYNSLGNCNGNDSSLHCLFSIAVTRSNQEINDLMNVSWDARIGTYNGML